MTAIRYGVVTVTYNPALDVLERQLSALAEAVGVVVVDNASVNAAQVSALTGALPQASFVGHRTNVGLAAGLNAGAHAALEHWPECEYLLFLDQDTEPARRDVARLMEAVASLRAADPRTGAVGPLMVDANSGLSHGVHVIRSGRWTRSFPDADGEAAVPCASVNGSGMVVPVDAFRKLGGFDEGFFIDHVDTEWSFRLAAAGFHLYTVSGVRFPHRMGQRSIRFWLGAWRVWPYRTPERHYYLFRNAVRLLRRPYAPRVWKLWAAPKLVLTALVHATVDGARRAQLRSMRAGVCDGWRGPQFVESSPRTSAGRRGPRM